MVVLVDGVAEPSSPVVVVVIKMVVDEQIGTVVVDVHVVESELVEVESVDVFEFDSVVFFSSSFSNSSSSAAISEMLLNSLLNFCCCSLLISFASGIVASISLRPVWVRSHAELIVLPISFPPLLRLSLALLMTQLAALNKLNSPPPPEEQPVSDDPPPELSLLSLCLT